MKISLLSILIGTTFIYGQTTGIIESQKYTLGNPASFYSGAVKINDSEYAIGSFITDLDGNIKANIPSYLVDDFAFSNKGIYVPYETKIIVTRAFAFVDYPIMNSIKSPGKAKKVDMERTKSDAYLSNEKCYDMPSSSYYFMSASEKVSDYCLFVWYNNLKIIENEKVIHEIEIKAGGRKLTQIHTTEGIYYALYVSAKKLTIVKVDLKTGVDQYVTIDNKHEYYSNAKIETVDDHIQVGVFFGTCDEKGGQTAEGFMYLTIKSADLSLIDKSEILVPTEYLEKLDFCDNILKSPEVLDIQNSGNDAYFLTTNYSGDFGPLAIWKVGEGELEFLSTIVAEDKAYIRSAKLFSFNSKTYLLYTLNEGKYPQKVTEWVKLAEIDGSEVSDMNLKIQTSESVGGSFNTHCSFMTNNGQIVVAANNGYNTCYLLKIQL